MAVNGWALGAIGAGAVFAWSALHGNSILGTARDLVRGQQPQPAPQGPSPFAAGGAGLGSPAGSPQAGSGNVSPLAVYKALRNAGVPRAAAVMLTAIAGVESGYNTLAWNQDAGTGDDSVGLFQINYLGSLYAARVALTGMTPEQLHLAGVQGQADAAARLYAQSGLQPWGPDISSGKVNQFLPGASSAATTAGF